MMTNKKPKSKAYEPESSEEESGFYFFFKILFWVNIDGKTEKEEESLSDDDDATLPKLSDGTDSKSNFMNQGGMGETNSLKRKLIQSTIDNPEEPPAKRPKRKERVAFYVYHFLSTNLLFKQN